MTPSLLARAVRIGLHAIAIALDFGLEMLFFWRGGAPMTISSRCGLALRKGETTTVLALLGRLLNWLSPGHCAAAIVADIERADAALALLEDGTWHV